MGEKNHYEIFFSNKQRFTITACSPQEAIQLIAKQLGRKVDTIVATNTGFNVVVSLLNGKRKRVNNYVVTFSPLQVDDVEFEITENKIKVVGQEYPYALKRADQLDNWYLYDKNDKGKICCVRKIGNFEPTYICEAIIKWGIADTGYTSMPYDIEQ